MTRSPLALAARCACASVLTVLSATSVAAAQIPGGGTAQPGAGLGGTTLSRAQHAPELPRYTVLELAEPDGFTTSHMTGLDPDGGGYGYGGIVPPPTGFDGYVRPVRFAPDGQAVALPTLVSDPGSDLAIAWRGDDLGLAVGFAPGWSGWFEDLTRTPYAWAGNVPLKLDLPVLYEGEAFDANESGRIVGFLRKYSASGFPKPEQAVVWDGVASPVTMLISLDAQEFSEARAVNASGQMCGTTAGMAVRWDAPHLPPVVLGGPPGAPFGRALHLNEAGDVVGEAWLVDRTVGFLHVAATSTTVALDALPGWTDARAVAVNARRQVVGFAYEGDPTSSSLRPGLLWQGGVVSALGDLLVPAQAPLYAIGHAWDVNDAGQICADAVRLADGASVAVRLDPVTPGS